MFKICLETKRRIKLSIWSYAYEFENVSLVDDNIYDIESYLIDLKKTTSRPDLDFWFICNFKPCTGMWINKHPELNKIKQLYNKYYRR